MIAQNPGTLDPSFGSNGVVLTDVNNVNNQSRAVAVQPDGKIIAGGDGSGFTIIRYNTDGSLDSNFGTGGIVTSVLTPYGEWVVDLALQSDGRIIALGSNNNGAQGIRRFIIARYLGDGSLDTSFGGGVGFNTVSFGTGFHGAHELAIQTDGKIIAVGQVNPDTAFLSAVCPSGSVRFPTKMHYLSGSGNALFRPTTVRRAAGKDVSLPFSNTLRMSSSRGVL